MSAFETPKLRQEIKKLRQHIQEQNIQIGELLPGTVLCCVLRSRLRFQDCFKLLKITFQYVGNP